MRTTTLAACGLAAALAGCSLITVQQDPFPPLEITAPRPGPPPPRVVVTPSSIAIPDKVQFEYNKATVLEVSFPLLDQVAQVMIENPQIEVLQVEGHTDSSGAAAYNRTLSQKRAEAVRQYLISKQVEAKRLVAKGFGPDKPIADNTTDAGREQNRRVEFNILKQGPKKTVVQDE